MRWDRNSDGTARAYCWYMTRIGLVVAVALTIAACSGSDTAVAPLETPASSTVVPAPTTEATPTTSTTTSVAETTTSTTTTVPETTTTFLEVEVQATDPADPTLPDLTPIFDEAFAAYAEVYDLRRAAFRDPANEALREELQTVIEPVALGRLIAVLDRFVDEGRASGPQADGDFIVLVRQIGATDDGGLVVFEVCQVLVSPILDVATGESLYEGEDAILSEASMSRIDGLWTLNGDAKKAEFEGTECQ
ncbi:MAG: hypothetical protein ACI8V4_003735 [Ilumatobacter sp.]|jgi:hypothetical protein